MIIGVDLGNYLLKSSNGFNVPSKVTSFGNIINSESVNINGKDLYFGEGDFDTEYRKINKKYIKEMFLYALYESTHDIKNKAVVGLPISQYKTDKDELKQILLSQRINQIEGNTLIIEDVEVYPEGVAAIYNKDFEGVIIDIGGRTTDIALITENNGVKKINDPYSLPYGTLNLYSDFIKLINSTHSLDLKAEDAERILKNGLKVYGQQIDVTFAMAVFKQYVEKLVSVLQVDYSIKTHDVLLIGGGSQMLFKPFKKRVQQAEIIQEPLFANAQGFQKVGEQLWQ